MVTDGGRALFRLPQWSPDFLQGLMIPVRRRPLFFSMQEEASRPHPPPPLPSQQWHCLDAWIFPKFLPPSTMSLRPLLPQSYNWFIMFSLAVCSRPQQPRPRANVHIWYWPQITQARQARGIINTPSVSRCQAPASGLPFAPPFAPVLGFAAVDR